MKISAQSKAHNFESVLRGLGAVRARTARLVQRATIIASLSIAALAASTSAALAEWEPPGIVATNATLADILATHTRSMGGDDARSAQRRERWTYVTGSHRIAVAVAVRGDDFRTSLELDGLPYTAGRKDGARWRADGNGIVHGVQADLQGDAVDRAPQAIFNFDTAACTLAGEALLPAPAWVIETHPDGDKPAFLFIDKTSGAIVREELRDGKRAVRTDFDQFERVAGALRARHWHIEDGNAANTVDVSVDAIEPGAVSAADVAFPERRTFAPATPLVRSANLDATFRNGRIKIAVGIDGKRHWFDLDCGTTSITIDPTLAKRHGSITLEHAVLPQVTIGPLGLSHVSVLTVPFWGEGLLGLDFFFGHVIDVDYLHNRVRVLSDADASAVFADPKTIVVNANVDQGLPLVQAAFGAAQSDNFAIDTGSPRLYVMRGFMSRFAQEIATHWTPAGPPYVETYLEGGIELQPYRVGTFSFGNATASNIRVGGQIPTRRTDDLSIPFDGIIGTDILRNFDLYFDYDHERLGLRR